MDILQALEHFGEDATEVVVLHIDVPLAIKHTVTIDKSKLRVSGGDEK